MEASGTKRFRSIIGINFTVTYEIQLQLKVTNSNAYCPTHYYSIKLLSRIALKRRSGNRDLYSCTRLKKYIHMKVTSKMDVMNKKLQEPTRRNSKQLMRSSRAT